MLPFDRPTVSVASTTSPPHPSNHQGALAVCLNFQDGRSLGWSWPHSGVPGIVIKST